MFPNKKICVDCKWMEYLSNGAQVCNHPKSNGFSCKDMRERKNTEDEFSTNDIFGDMEICGRDGKWFEVKN
jgi:hypothetical protein